MNKKFLSVAASTAIMASALVFTGCGDSSSSSTPAATSSGTASGTSTATFFKGAWSGISYTTSSGQSSTTTTGGNFTYSGDANVTFDLGLLDLKFTNVTALKTNGVLYAAQGTSGNTNATVTSTEIGNLLAVLAPFGINETSASSTNLAKLGTMLSALKALKAQDPATYNATSALMDTNKVTIGLAAKTGVANTTVAGSATDAYAAYAAAAAANMQASGANVANLNNTFLNNKAIFLSDGTILAMNGTMLGGAMQHNPSQVGVVAKSLVGGFLAGLGANGPQSNSSNATIANVSNGWSASGAFINLTPTGVNDTIAFNGPFAKGTTVTVTNGTGFMRTLTVAGIGYNLVPALVNAGLNGTVATNKTITVNGNTYTLQGNTTVQAGAGWNLQGNLFINGTYAQGMWNVSNSTYGYALNLTNATGTGVNQTVAFDDDIVANTGVVATIWNTVSSSVSTLIAAFLKVVSTASKLI